MHTPGGSSSRRRHHKPQKRAGIIRTPRSIHGQAAPKTRVAPTSSSSMRLLPLALAVALAGAAFAASEAVSAPGAPLREWAPLTTPAILGDVYLPDQRTVPTMEVLLNNGEYRTYTEGNGSFAFYGVPEGGAAVLTHLDHFWLLAGEIRRLRAVVGFLVSVRIAYALCKGACWRGNAFCVCVCLCVCPPGVYVLEVVSPSYIFSTVPVN